jgi:ubiquinone/menaquinone biosynthesis C-methylase UbiE
MPPTTRVSHPIFARFWGWMSPRMDRSGAADLRGRLLEGLSGRVLEVGAGNGLNFAHYPAGVSSVLAVEPEAHLRREALANAARAPVPVDVVEGVADRLPAEDESVDAIVYSLVLCSVPDQVRALREGRRVLRPDGRLRFFEHVRAESASLRRVQTLLDATVWPTLGGGCHAGRDTAAAIESAGFAIEEIEHFRFPDMRVALPTSPHILGIARLP